MEILEFFTFHVKTSSDFQALTFHGTAGKLITSYNLPPACICLANINLQYTLSVRECKADL